MLSFGALLGGSWVVISGVISRVTIVIVPIYGLIATHEPPSRVRGLADSMLIQNGGGLAGPYTLNRGSVA